MIGAVMQEDKLFAGSIADNISFFDANSDQVRIEECARLAVIHDEIASMPMGYNTLIGDMGDAALRWAKAAGAAGPCALQTARRSWRSTRPPVISTLHCERGVNEAVRSLKLTRIIIAHRPETIAMAARIIALSNVTEARARAQSRHRTRLPSRGEGLAQQAPSISLSIHSIR